MADDVVVINVPGPGDPSVVEVVRPGGDVVVVPEGVDVQDVVDAAVAGHVADPTPHPAYDDMPSLALIFQNGLV